MLVIKADVNGFVSYSYQVRNLFLSVLDSLSSRETKYEIVLGFAWKRLNWNFMFSKGSFYVIPVHFKAIIQWNFPEKKCPVN